MIIQPNTRECFVEFFETPSLRGFQRPIYSSWKSFSEGYVLVILFPSLPVIPCEDVFERTHKQLLRRPLGHPNTDAHKVGLEDFGRLGIHGQQWPQFKSPR